MSHDGQHGPPDFAEEEPSSDADDPQVAEPGAVELADEEPPDEVALAEGEEPEVYELDDADLVGPGKYPLRIQPAAAIMPGEADSKRLLRIWFVRKSFYWLSFLGMSVAVIVEAVESDGDRLVIQQEMSWPWAMFFVALGVRFVSGWVALGLALPLALAHEPNLSPRTNFGSSIGKFFDRLHIARAFRSLRWTHHVRQVAQHRLGERGRRLGKLDPIFDIINIASGVILGITIIASAILVAS